MSIATLYQGPKAISIIIQYAIIKVTTHKLQAEWMQGLHGSIVHHNYTNQRPSRVLYVCMYKFDDYILQSSKFFSILYEAVISCV